LLVNRTAVDELNVQIVQKLTDDTLNDDIKGKLCIVRYDGGLYPGVILDIDEDNTLEVKCMHKVGPNRFFWPAVEDVLWYKVDDIVSLISEPTSVTKRPCII